MDITLLSTVTTGHIKAICLCFFIGLIGCKSDHQKTYTQDSTTANGLISAESALKYVNQQDITFIDVRTPKEIAEGKIQGALEINYRDSDFTAQIEKLDKLKPYIIYCKSGGRSGRTFKQMKTLGFEKIQDLDGGYTAYKQLSN